MQPFLLVKLPDFKYYITNRRTIDVLCYFSLTLQRARKTKPFPRNRSFRRPFSPVMTFSLFVTHIMTTRAFLASRKTRPAGLDLFNSVLSYTAELASFVVVVGEVRFGNQAVTMPEVSSLPASCMRSMSRGVSWWCFVLKRTVCGLTDRSEVICSHRNRCQRLLAGYSLPLSIAFSN